MFPLYWWRPLQGRIGPDVLGSVRALFQGQPPFCNFGDELSPLIVGRLTEQPVMRAARSARNKLLGVGSILSATRSGDKVWGSGLLAESDVPAYCNAEIFCVRGPRSRKALVEKGYRVPEVYGDPAALLPYLFDWAPEPRWRIGLVPHFSDHKKLVKSLAPDPAVRVINVLGSPQQVIQEIIDCDVIYGSSLHGLIVANAFGIPHGWLRIGQNKQTNSFKYYDYFETSGSVPSCMQWKDGSGWDQFEKGLRQPVVMPPHMMLDAFPFQTPAMRRLRGRLERLHF